MENSAKKKAAVSAVAAVTAASVLVGGAFNSPADILDEGPDALVRIMDMESQTDAGDDSGEGSAEDEDKGIKASVRKLVHKAPLPLRALVALPLWLVGTGLIGLGDFLWGTLLSPVAGAVINWAAVALMVLAVFLLAAKTVAPELPIRKILNKKTVPGILLLCLAFAVLDALLPLFWDAYDSFARYLRAGGSLICTAVPLAFFLRRHMHRIKREEQRQQAEELSYARREAEARALIEELADSVSRHY